VYACMHACMYVYKCNIHTVVLYVHTGVTTKT
jgi:hypothetical protein